MTGRIRQVSTHFPALWNFARYCLVPGTGGSPTLNAFTDLFRRPVPNDVQEGAVISI